MLSSVGWAALGVGFIFLMTSLGAASVLFCREDASIKSQTGMMGFAGGVMTAATVWSMLLPAIEQTRSEGTLPCWLPAAAGTAAGAAFLCALDALILRLRRGGSAEKSSMLMTAITLHNIPEGMAVGLAFALSGGADGLTAAAALALGMTRWQAMREVILPQAVRVVIPPITNDFISLLKDSSLVSIITMVDLTKVYGQVSATYYDYFGPGIIVAIIYLILGLPFVRFARFTEKRLAAAENDGKQGRRENIYRSSTRYL